VVPNITVNGVRLDNLFEEKSYAQHIAELCGAVAISHYGDDLCFNAVKKFTDADTLDEYVLKINKINEALKADPLYNFMVKYTDSEPMFINEAWVDN